MMSIMRMRSAILTIAYSISFVFNHKNVLPAPNASLNFYPFPPLPCH